MTTFRTGDQVIRTGRYRTDCPCKRQIDSVRLSTFPNCGRCGRPVNWLFLRALVAPGEASRI